MPDVNFSHIREEPKVPSDEVVVPEQKILHADGVVVQELKQKEVDKEVDNLRETVANL